MSQGQGHDDDHQHETPPVASAVDWRDNGVRVIKANQLDPNTAQTPGMNRAAAINAARVGAQKIWAGTVSIHANAKTGAHHHGALESVRRKPAILSSCPLMCRTRKSTLAQTRR